MPLATKMFDWKDREVRRADEVYIAVVVVLTIAMLLGALFAGF